MFAEASFLVSAVASYASAREQARAEAYALARREHELWQDEHLLPTMTPEQAERFLAERRRLEERREDIAREERQHLERIAAEREKAAAVREAGRRDSGGFLRGLIWGEILGGHR